jgi:hypothetical protein
MINRRVRSERGGRRRSGMQRNHKGAKGREGRSVLDVISAFFRFCVLIGVCGRETWRLWGERGRKGGNALPLLIRATTASAYGRACAGRGGGGGAAWRKPRAWFGRKMGGHRGGERGGERGGRRMWRHNAGWDMGWSEKGWAGEHRRGRFLLEGGGRFGEAGGTGPAGRWRYEGRRGRSWRGGRLRRIGRLRGIGVPGLKAGGIPMGVARGPVGSGESIGGGGTG